MIDRKPIAGKGNMVLTDTARKNARRDIQMYKNRIVGILAMTI